jgi:succinate dehydrogenase / fumarate reductase iron-sulfur subunit
VIKDLSVNRSSLDRIVAAGGFVSINTGSTVDGNTIPIGKRDADEAMDYAGCIGCGACVAACPNAAAMLFTGAKVAHLVKLPQGQVERSGRVLNMVAQMDKEGFGSCTNHGECSEACPKEIPFDAIIMLNREYMRASVLGKSPARRTTGAARDQKARRTYPPGLLHSSCEIRAPARRPPCPCSRPRPWAPEA